MTQPRPETPTVPGAEGLSTLMRRELALARAEVLREITRPSKAAKMYGGAGFAGYMVLLFASIALWWGLGNVVSNGWAAVIVTVIWAVIGAVLYAMARREAGEINRPDQTIEMNKLPDTL